MVKITKIAFEKRYSDDSGVEFAVRYDANAMGGELEVERVNAIDFPIDQLDWLIESLTEIRKITLPSSGEGGE